MRASWRRETEREPLERVRRSARLVLSPGAAARLSAAVPGDADVWSYSLVAVGAVSFSDVTAVGAPTTASTADDRGAVCVEDDSIYYLSYETKYANMYTTCCDLCADESCAFFQTDEVHCYTANALTGVALRTARPPASCVRGRDAGRDRSFRERDAGRSV